MNNLTEQEKAICKDFDKMQRIKGLCRDLYYSDHSIYGFNGDAANILDKRCEFPIKHIEQKYSIKAFKGVTMLNKWAKIWSIWQVSKFENSL